LPNRDPTSKPDFRTKAGLNLLGPFGDEGTAAKLPPFRRLPRARSMHTNLSLLASLCLFVVIAAAPADAQPNAAANADADVCAAGNDGAFSPPQRIAACTALIEATKDAPKELANWLVDRGAAYWYVNKIPQALGDLDRAIALDPTNARAFRERSNSHRSAGRIDLALADANESLRLDPHDAKAFDNRGNVFNNNGQYDRAIEDYNEALRLDPGFGLAFMDRGAAYYFKMEYEHAIEDYDEAIKLDPGRDRAYANRGAAYKKLGRTEQALADESEAIRLDPSVPEYFDNRGLSYAGNGDYERAIIDYNEAIRLAPQANFLTNRGDSYQFKGDLDRAISDYDRALKLNPGFDKAYNNRGSAFEKKGDIDRAMADYEQALRVNPRFDSAAENLAAIRQERDRRDTIGQSMLPTFSCAAARRAVEKAICSDPDLSRLDRQIDDAYKAALAKLDRKGVSRLREEQRDFNTRRNRSFGSPDYQLKRELEARLLALRAMASGN
jgi:tetratricopeptide (TPR) repeat protein